MLHLATAAARRRVVSNALVAAAVEVLWRPKPLPVTRSLYIIS